MSNSLQDQLVQAGLADPDQARKRGRDDARKGAGRGDRKGKPGGKGQARGGQAKKRAGGEDPKRGPRRGGRAGADAAPPQSARERTARLRQLVKANRLDRTGADIPYRFTAGRRIKEITVTADQQGRLARGETGIVNVQGHYDVVPAAIIDEVRALDDKAVVLLNAPDERAGTDTGDAGDPYADRPVPDDLTW